jgi:hypothetical protein
VPRLGCSEQAFHARHGALRSETQRLIEQQHAVERLPALSACCPESLVAIVLESLADGFVDQAGQLDAALDRGVVLEIELRMVRSFMRCASSVRKKPAARVQPTRVSSIFEASPSCREKHLRMRLIRAHFDIGDRD